jgi:hypothetical protein
MSAPCSRMVATALPFRETAILERMSAACQHNA